MGIGQVSGDDGKIILPWRAYYMDRALPVSIPEDKATVPSGILRIIFDDFSLTYNPANLCSTDHTIRPQHLAECRRQEKNLLLRFCPNLDQNLRFSFQMRISKIRT